MDASRNSSSSRSGNDYSTSLIGTVAELRMELQRTMAEIQTIKEQNRALQTNSHSLKDELVETRRKYTEAQENYMATVTEKLDAERQNEAFLDRVKKQLMDKTKEFEALRERNAPQDIDTIRIKVQEELEIPHRERVMKLQAEIQDQRNKFFAMKREMENWRSECDNVTRHRSREVAALKEQHEKVERKLREENARLMDREIPQERDEQKLRLQGAEIQELTHLLKMARDEVKVARQGKEDAELALEQSISKREEVTAQFRAKIALVESQELSLEQQVHHAHAEVERKELLMRSMGRQVEEMTTQLEHVKKELSDAESRLATTIADQANAIGDLKAEFDVERNDLEHHIVQLQEKLYDREELVRRSQRIATEMQVRAEAVESELRKEHQYKIQEITKKLAAAELQLAEEKMTSKTAELKNKKEQEEIEAELDVLKSELARISREKDVLHEKVRELEGKLDGEKRATASIRRESTTMVRALEATVKELKYKVTDLEAKNLHAKTAEIDLQYSLQTVQGKLDGIQAENSAVIEALKNEARQRALEQDKLYAEKLEKIKENSRAVIEKEKKRADGYKGKAQDALKRGKLLSDTALAAAASSYGVLPVPTAGMTTEEMMAMTATLQLR